MAIPYQLLIYPPILADGNTHGGVIASLAEYAKEWKRSTRAMGGYWSGSFKLDVEPAIAEQWFYESLGFHVEERAAGEKTWEGRIYEIDMAYGGYRYRRSISKIFNAIKVKYRDSTTDADTETAYATDSNSINTYGRREMIDVQGKISSGWATARRDMLLRELSVANADFVAFEKTGEQAKLEVRVMGYAFTLNDKFVTVQDGATVNVSAYIDAILATDCQFVASRLVRANTVQVRQQTTMQAHAWDAMKRLAELGDASGNPWALRMDNNRMAIYEAIDPTPLYYVRSGKWYARGGSSAEVNPWTVRPGVVRNLDYIFARKNINAFLQDARDVFAGEIEVDHRGNVSPKHSLYSESEILNAQYKEGVTE